MPLPKYRVIIVGGGPVGLTAAHALGQAEIDYTVLESRDSLDLDVGASLVLWPQGLRVLAQLGLLEGIRRIGTLMTKASTITLKSHLYNESDGLRVIQENHGSSTIVMHRAELVRLLHMSLGDEDRAKLQTGKKVIDIVHHDHGVDVICADGSKHRGSIVIGADGAHSTVRRLMHGLALSAGVPASKLNDEATYVAEYRALWCVFPRPPGLESGHVFDTHGKDVSLQCLSNAGRSWIFIYERLPKPTRERVSYSQEDIDALVARNSEMAISTTLKVKDVYPSRYTAGLTNLEEGIVKQWSWKRIVLAGDACHKFTPNQGLGYNNGIQDVVALVNGLRGMVDAGPAAASADALAAAFEEYQATRMKNLAKDYNFSASTTRMSAWRSWTAWLMDRYILPRLPAAFESYILTRVVGKVVSEGLVLNHPGHEAFEGKVPWKNAMRPLSVKP